MTWRHDEPPRGPFLLLAFAALVGIGFALLCVGAAVAVTR